MSSRKDSGGRKRWSIPAVVSFFLAVAAALASFFWPTIWRSPFQKWAEPRYVIATALVAMVISGVVGFVFKPQKKRGLWLAWIALALSFGTLVSFNLMTGDMLKEGRRAGGGQQQETTGGQPAEADDPNDSEKVAETAAAEANEPAPEIAPETVEPNEVAEPADEAVSEPNAAGVVEPNVADANEGGQEVVRIDEDQFSGFTELVEDVRQRRFDGVYDRFTDKLKQRWPKDAFIADMNSFRDDIGEDWSLRPGGFSGGYDEQGVYFLCAVVLSDSNDYQMFAELAAEGDSFEVNRLTPMRLKLVDEELAARVRATATRFVGTLMSGDYVRTLRMIEPREADRPEAEELARIRRAIRGGTFDTPQFVFSLVDWMIECGQDEYGIEAVPLNSTRTQLRMVLYEPNSPEIAVDFIQLREPAKDPNE